MTARAGLSLLEVIIALGLVTLLLGAAIESVSGVRRFIGEKEMDNDLVIEGRQIIDTIVGDLGSSAWLIPGDVDDDGNARAPDGTDADDLAALSDTAPVTPPRDRTLRYYPYIVAQTDAAIPAVSHFRGLLRDPAERIDPAALPSALPPAHRELSREVVFTRVRTAPVVATPAAVQPSPIDFGQAPASISDFRGGRHLPPGAGGAGGGVLSDLLALKPGASALDDTPLDWETDPAWPGHQWATATGAARTRLVQADHAREYTYVVVPHAATGKGRLERRYRNQGAGFDRLRPAQLDRVLSTNVDRIVVDTYRTAADLGVNQVRIALYLSKEVPDQPGIFHTHRLQVTAALRCTVDPEYALQLKDVLAGRSGGTAASGVFTQGLPGP